MSDKNIAIATLIVAAIGTIVISVLAYKLSSAQDRVSQATSDPVGFVKGLLG